ncbi:MAG: hypothetical protein ACI4D3_13530 [Lachnospiraceae bacterium]
MPAEFIQDSSAKAELLRSFALIEKHAYGRLTVDIGFVILDKIVYMTKILQRLQKVNIFLNMSKLFVTRIHLYTVSGKIQNIAGGGKRIDGIHMIWLHAERTEECRCEDQIARQLKIWFM